MKSKKTNRKPERPRLLPASGGYAGRVLLEKLKAEMNERRLAACAALLTEAGVPEWVENSDCRGVPANATVARLKWYLARRKSVAKYEIDNKLQRDMAAWMRQLSRHNTKLTDSRE